MPKYLLIFPHHDQMAVYYKQSFMFGISPECEIFYVKKCEERVQDAYCRTAPGRKDKPKTVIYLTMLKLTGCFSRKRKEKKSSFTSPLILTHHLRLKVLEKAFLNLVRADVQFFFG
jgi:hypothetical protein